MRIWITVAAIVALTASTAAAQEAGQIGVTMAVPESIGFIWHIAERVAVRPEFSFSSSAADDGPIEGARSSGKGGAVNLTALFYVARWEALRMVIAPSYGYGWSRSESSFPSFITLPPPLGGGSSTIESRSTTSIHRASGSLGAQYSMHKRFAVGGEMGMEYSRARTHGTTTGPSFGGVFDPLGLPTRTIDSRAGSHLFGTASRVGIIFYF